MKLYFILSTKPSVLSSHCLRICTTYVYMFLTNVCLIRLDKDIGYLLSLPAHPPFISSFQIMRISWRKRCKGVVWEES